MRAFISHNFDTSFARINAIPFVHKLAVILEGGVYTRCCVGLCVCKLGESKTKNERRFPNSCTHTPRSLIMRYYGRNQMSIISEPPWNNNGTGSIYKIILKNYFGEALYQPVYN